SAVLASYSMAQPAWVVRVRRARSLQRSRSGKRPGRLPNRLSVTSPERAWAEWVAHLLFMLLPRTGGSAQAIEGARAALDDIATTEPKHAVLRIPWPRLAQLHMGPGRVPLQLAAHMVAVAVVLGVALGTRVPERLLQRPAVVAAAPAIQIDRSAVDILVPRAAAAHPAPLAVATPAARLPDAQSLPAFAE